MAHIHDRAQRSLRHRRVGVVESCPQLTPQRIVRYSPGQSAKAGLGAVALTIDRTQHEGAGAAFLRWCQFDAGKPSRHSFPSVAGSKEIRITLKECERRFDRLGLTAVETRAELADARVDVELVVVRLTVFVSPSHRLSRNHPPFDSRVEWNVVRHPS